MGLRVQRYKQTSEKYEVYFNIFHSECSKFYLKIHKSGQYSRFSLMNCIFLPQTIYGLHLIIRLQGCLIPI